MASVCRVLSSQGSENQRYWLGWAGQVVGAPCSLESGTIAKPIHHSLRPSPPTYRGSGQVPVELPASTYKSITRARRLAPTKNSSRLITTNRKGWRIFWKEDIPGLEIRCAMNHLWEEEKAADHANTEKSPWASH